MQILAKNNRKKCNFICKNLEKTAGISICVFNATEPKISLNQNVKSSLLKLYLSDVGLLTYTYGPAMKLGLLSDNKTLNCGGIYENAVNQELFAHGFKLYYYNSKKMENWM